LTGSCSPRPAVCYRPLWPLNDSPSVVALSEPAGSQPVGRRATQRDWLPFRRSDSGGSPFWEPEELRSSGPDAITGSGLVSSPALPCRMRWELPNPPAVFVSSLEPRTRNQPGKLWKPSKNERLLPHPAPESSKDLHLYPSCFQSPAALPQPPAREPVQRRKILLLAGRPHKTLAESSQRKTA
jgi:hypothetical protein